VTEILVGAAQLSQSEEAALNVLLHRSAGDAEGMPLYKISWAARDNAGKAIPLCFHECQASYHLLSWEPPSAAFNAYATHFKGEDFSRGSYACLLHFVDPQTKNPFNPTNALMENIIPRLKAMRELAEAARHGYNATVEKLRREKIAKEKERQAREEKRWDAHADEVLKEASERAAADKTRLETDVRTEVQEQPEEFVFTARAKRP
jgi:hypothetical protein